MDPQFLVSVLSRFLHVATAVVLVGGLTALRFVVAPALAAHPEQMEAIRQRWKKYVHAGIGLFLITGGYNYVVAIGNHQGDGAYHALLGTKMLLALVVFFLASALVGRSHGTQKFRDNSARWKAIVLLIAFVVIGISSFAKVRGIPAKSTDGVPASDAVEAE